MMDIFEEIRLLKAEYAELSNHLCELEREEQEVDELIASAHLERQKIEEETTTLLRTAASVEVVLIEAQVEVEHLQRFLDKGTASNNKIREDLETIQMDNAKKIQQLHHEIIDPAEELKRLSRKLEEETTEAQQTLKVKEEENQKKRNEISALEEKKRELMVTHDLRVDDNTTQRQDEERRKEEVKRIEEKKGQDQPLPMTKKTEEKPQHLSSSTSNIISKPSTLPAWDLNIDDLMDF
ncbi:hypothetical protein PROFUN_03077 [Planoprotostelium fungivorum]|uniref:Uncharacterized protein n=1 Tax=Planoprotostelium fungivorum TaxID=1890364 RepID=A0A2P6NQ62_9EUKA|nr:hypothetical protein PROFUN_03077 [Planoprotostelium fungivorum]